MLALITPIKDKIRNPENMQYLQDEGEVLSVSTYWLKREREGAVSIKEIKESIEAEKKLKENKK